MKYFWIYVILCIFVWLICTYVITIRETSQQSESFSNSAEEDEKKPDEILTRIYNANDKIPDYHEDEETIRALNKHKMQNMYVKGDDGKVVPIYMEPTQTFTTYYTPGSFPHGASNYVPTYEDSVKLANAEVERTYGHEYHVVRNDNGSLTMRKIKKKKL